MKQVLGGSGWRRGRLLAALALIAALGTAGCGSGSGGARGSGETARLLLDFQPNAVHAGIYTAVARGYDEAEGVQLRITVPGATTDVPRLLAAGKVDFAVLDIHDLGLAREKGRDLVGVMALVQRPLAAVLAQPGIRSPRDLEGKLVGVTGLPSDTAVLRSVVSGAGGDPRRVRTITVGFDAVRSLLTRRVAGATAFWNVEGLELRRRRPGTREFRVDEFGAPAYPELVLAVRRETLQDRPATVRAAVRALVRGYDEVLADPESGVSDLIQANPGLERSVVSAQLGAVQAAFRAPDGRVGVLRPGVLRAWGLWDVRFGILKQPPYVARAFKLG